jgi:hypothetical protein
VVLIGAGRRPAHDVLAGAAASPDRSGVASSSVPPVRLPEPTGRQVRQPASLSRPTSKTGQVGVSGIPAVALTAYQRSSVVIDAADPACRLDWTLLAAIGQVESDHGRAGGSHLGQDGIAHPPIVGPRLDGRHGTSRVTDSDAGRLDGDKRFDRAVGPMQFLPSTWAAVAVDGDDDGHRDVQDINDAALGSAVYLCVGDDDLSTEAGRMRALLRYNHSHAYATRVLSIAADYRHTSVSASPTVEALGPLPDVGLPGRDQGRDESDHSGAPVVQWGGVGDPGAATSTSPPADPTPPQTPTPDPTPDPTPTPTPTPDPTPTPTPTPTPIPTEAPVLPDPLPDELSDLTSDQVEAYDAAWAVCDDDLVAGWSADADTVDALTTCLAEQVELTTDDPVLTAVVEWLESNQDPVTTQPPADPVTP